MKSRRYFIWMISIISSILLVSCNHEDPIPMIVSSQINFEAPIVNQRMLSNPQSTIAESIRIPQSTNPQYRSLQPLASGSNRGGHAAGSRTIRAIRMQHRRVRLRAERGDMDVAGLDAGGLELIAVGATQVQVRAS